MELIRDVVKPMIAGFGITVRRLKHKKVTVMYPDAQREQFPRTRWRHFLTRYESGLEKCIGCSLCAAACPADAIFVEAAANSDEQRFSPGERYASTYEINMLRCIFCGYCEDACPTEAIVLESQYELAFTDRDSSIYTKDMLIVPVPPGGQPTPQKVEPGKFDKSIPEMKDPSD